MLICSETYASASARPPGAGSRPRIRWWERSKSGSSSQYHRLPSRTGTRRNTGWGSTIRDAIASETASQSGISENHTNDVMYMRLSGRSMCNHN
ncbi:hypothetical protein GCM10009831_06040 [Dietzia cercidiphylli]|uniref:Uncharacterized protein n=1 Tax=Dietzia cercidiphylli TaxID=498199 RepID=A0ABN2I8B4_9ACTN